MKRLICDSFCQSFLLSLAFTSFMCNCRTVMGLQPALLLRQNSLTTNSDPFNLRHTRASLPTTQILKTRRIKSSTLARPNMMLILSSSRRSSSNSQDKFQEDKTVQYYISKLVSILKLTSKEFLQWCHRPMPGWQQWAIVLVYYFFHLMVLSQHSLLFGRQLIPNEKGHFCSVGWDSIAGVISLAAFYHFKRGSNRPFFHRPWRRLFEDFPKDKQPDDLIVTNPAGSEDTKIPKEETQKTEGSSANEVARRVLEQLPGKILLQRSSSTSVSKPEYQVPQFASFNSSSASVRDYIPKTDINRTITTNADVLSDDDIKAASNSYSRVQFCTEETADNNGHENNDLRIKITESNSEQSKIPMSELLSEEQENSLPAPNAMPDNKVHKNNTATASLTADGTADTNISSTSTVAEREIPNHLHDPLLEQNSYKFKMTDTPEISNASNNALPFSVKPLTATQPLSMDTLTNTLMVLQEQMQKLTIFTADYATANENNHSKLEKQGMDFSVLSVPSREERRYILTKGSSLLATIFLVQTYFATGRFSFFWEDTLYAMAGVGFPLTMAMHRSLCVLLGHLTWVSLGTAILGLIPRPKFFGKSNKWYRLNTPVEDGKEVVAESSRKVSKKLRRKNWLWWVIAGYSISAWFFNIADFTNLYSLPQQVLEDAIMQEGVVTQLINPENNDFLASVVGYIAPCISAPWWEEILYRGFFFPALSMYVPVWASVLISGIVFSAHHLSLTAALPLAVLGWTWSGLYMASDNLWTTIVVHALWNSRVFLSSWLGL